jgi:F420-non-reducing hydrogenase large subunit
LGDDTPTHYIGAVEPRHTYYGSTIRIMAPDGTEAEAFDPCDYARYLTEVPLESSYSNGTLYREQILNCNSLARANMLPVMGTPRADAYLERFHREWGCPAHAILLFDLARGIELIYGIERAIEILEEDLDSSSGAEGDLRVGYTPRDGEGCGLVEAPRGPLIHHYSISDGVIRRAKFIIPTQHNILAIERALRVAAERYITEQGISLELERAMGRVVRAFDPCIACATH